MMNKPLGGSWRSHELDPPVPYNCPYCGSIVTSDRGIECRDALDANRRVAAALICSHPKCQAVTYVDPKGVLHPSPRAGKDFFHLPDDIERLWNECRIAAGSGAYLAFSMCARTMLMYVALEHGAKENDKFEKCVEVLDEARLLPAVVGREWLTSVRRMSNAAAHDVVVISRRQAREAFRVLESLLDQAYEIPGEMR